MWLLAFVLMFVPIVLFAFGFVWLLGKRFTPGQMEHGLRWVEEFPGPIVEWLGDRLTPGARRVSGPEGLAGASGTVLSADSLWVQVNGERWRAECAAPVPAGARVRVVKVRGMVLVVEGT